MRRHSRPSPANLLSRAWRSVVFVMALRAVAKPYRSRRLYPAVVDDELDGVAVQGRLQ